MKIGILTAGGRIARWQADALRAVAAGNLFVIYDCTNAHAPRRIIAHGAYYLLNLIAVRNPLTRRVEVPGDLDIVGRIRFEAERDGTWERLPPTLLDQIRRDAPDVILKFGMGLLRVPSDDQLACPMLSYHHGDPGRFRGRPAGMYELVAGEATIGQIVQILSDRLDGGEVVAFAETKAHAHSWRQSLIDAFKVSPLLLPEAIANALAGKTLPIARDGRNYRLPSNATAARFALKLGAAKAFRLAYGAFAEKGWRIAEAELPAGASLADLAQLDDFAQWKTIDIPRPYTFLADPFVEPGGALLAEAMRRNGRGDIVRFEHGKHAPLPIAGGHLSYPCTFEVDGRRYVLPEMADWSHPRIYELTETGAEQRGELDVGGKPRLLDATLHRHHGQWFLFANRMDEGSGVLRLWAAYSPFGRFSEHPASPIRISPAGARMGGGILDLGGEHFRPGQDFRGGYGDGLVLFRIDELSASAYRESEAASLRFTHCRGPHTLNVLGNRALFDFYRDRFTPLAGWRRLKQFRSG